MAMTLENTVIKNGFCVGCAACSAVNGSNYQIKFDNYGCYTAYQKEETSNEVEKKLSQVCPFTSSINETHISRELFGNDGAAFHEHIGYYQGLYAGHVINEEYRLSSSSGGLVSKVLEILFEQKLIDGVLHVKRSSENGELFNYSISNSIKELQEGKKSRYYPINLMGVLKAIKGDGKRYAVVGIPCFVKSIRLLQREESGFENIKFFIGIICGQLKSKYFTDVFKIPLQNFKSEITDIDFRIKLKNKPAHEYAVGFKTSDMDDFKITKPAKYIFGSDWGFGTLKYKSCDACDDVFNETADIVFGDAWVYPYSEDWKGTNLMIIRNAFLKKLLFENPVMSSEVNLTTLSEKDTLTTQEPSVRHRRQNLRYRLEVLKKNHDWVPAKRLDSVQISGEKNRKIQDLRLKFASRSHYAMYYARKYNIPWFFEFRLMMISLKLRYYRIGPKAFVPSIVKKKLKLIFKKK